MKEGIHECFRVLELGDGATFEEARRAYYELVKVWHPDRFQHDERLTRRANEKLKQLNSAYETLQQFYKPLGGGAGESHGDRSKPRSQTRPSQREQSQEAGQKSESATSNRHRSQRESGEENGFHSRVGAG